MSCAAEYVAKQAEKEEQRAAALAAKAAAKEARRREMTQVGLWWRARRLANCTIAAHMIVLSRSQGMQNANTPTQHCTQR